MFDSETLSRLSLCVVPSASRHLIDFVCAAPHWGQRAKAAPACACTVNPRTLVPNKRRSYVSTTVCLEPVFCASSHTDVWTSVSTHIHIALPPLRYREVVLQQKAPYPPTRQRRVQALRGGQPQRIDWQTAPIIEEHEGVLFPQPP